MISQSIIPSNTVGVSSVMQSSSVTDSTTRLGRSDLTVRRIGLGAWPMAGITSLGVTDEDSIATIRRALDLGIDHLDTAYSYGKDGRSDRVIAAALHDRAERVVVASKVGAYLDSQGVWTKDARPESMLQQASEVRDRLRLETIDLMYLHAPDPNVPLSESADALKRIVELGWARWAGICNVNRPQLEDFHRRCPVVAVQTYFNMFQQESVEDLRDFCRSHSISIVVYWALMKGMLAGRMLRDHQLDPLDRRRNYPIYQGEQWQSAQDLLDRLRSKSQQLGCTVAQLVLAWTLAQPCISVALVGAKRPEQVEETARSMEFTLQNDVLATIDNWIADCKQHGAWKL
ncbi:MAG: aldo/keto reductase [Planctomycetes bacterium]|nr:aldo/keto reductase [Planctomycetota bacterium]